MTRLSAISFQASNLVLWLTAQWIVGGGEEAPKDRQTRAQALGDGAHWVNGR